MAKKKVFLLFLEYIFSDPKDSMSLFSYICFNLISISVDYLDIMLKFIQQNRGIFLGSNFYLNSSLVKFGREL